MNSRVNQRVGAALLLLAISVASGRVVARESTRGGTVKPVAEKEDRIRKLFEEKGWYKTQAGKEQNFHGVLEAVPSAGGMSTLMRAAFYRLGKYTIYTAAKKVPVLDALAGKDVVITGKAVSMSLEGRQLLEIWPASIRLEKCVAAETVVKGLSVEVMPAKKVFTISDSPSFTIAFKNVSKKGFVLYDAAFSYGWEYRLRKKTGETLQAVLQAEVKRAAPESTVLEPGKSLNTKVLLGRVTYSFKPIADLRNKHGEGEKATRLLSRLKPGSYELTITIRLREHPQAAMMDMLYGYWSGTVVTKSIKFEISSDTPQAPFG